MIHYAQCWEDPRTLLQALEVTAEDDVLSIASGGENSFALLLQNSRSVVAVDRNPEQLYLVELKMRAVQRLEYRDYVAFIGLRDAQDRTGSYSLLRPLLGEDARRYWDAHLDDIRRGIVHSGKFEQYFSLFRRFVLPLIHRRRDVERLLGGESLDTQRRCYDEVWNNRRWRRFFRIFFGKFLLGRLGRHPSLFRHVRMEDVAAELLRRTEHGLTEVPIRDNYFVEYIVTGKYRNPEHTHPYLSEEDFYHLRDRLDQIRLVHQDLIEYLSTLPPGSISKFNLSDVFEYMSDAEYEETLRAIHRVARNGARMAFWTLFVPRKLPFSLTSCFHGDDEETRKKFSTYGTFFYGGFHVWTINNALQENHSMDGSRASGAPR
jgi:S-adenosylmethionine-diacylglycerol 3-amino-3-carboxypropyl transferase